MNIKLFLNKFQNINFEQVNIHLKPLIFIIGNVDNGKTTLFQYITQQKCIEQYNITQDLYLFENDNFVLLDSPGHAAFHLLRNKLLEHSKMILYMIGFQRTKNITFSQQFVDKTLFLYTFTDGQKENDLINNLIQINLMPLELGGLYNVKALQYSQYDNYDKLSDLSYITDTALKEYLVEYKLLSQDEEEIIYDTKQGVVGIIVGSLYHKFRGHLYIVLSLSLGNINRKGIINTTAYEANSKSEYVLYDYKKMSNINLNTQNHRLFYIKTSLNLYINEYYYFSNKAYKLNDITNQNTLDSDNPEYNSANLKIAIISSSINKIEVINNLTRIQSKKYNINVSIFSHIGNPSSLDENLLISNQYNIICFDSKWQTVNIKPDLYINSSSFYDIEQYVEELFIKKQNELFMSNIKDIEICRGQIIKIFHISKQTIYGVKISQGILTNQQYICVMRKTKNNQNIIYQKLHIQNLKISNDVVLEVLPKQNVGILFKEFNIELELNDIIISYSINEK